MEKSLRIFLTKRVATVALLLFVSGIFLFAQGQVRISGTVTDGNEPMIGVNVIEKGTNNGVITDVNGKYTLTVSQGARVVYSFIGYVTQEITANQAGEINITMNEEAQVFDEV